MKTMLYMIVYAVLYLGLPLLALYLFDISFYVSLGIILLITWGENVIDERIKKKRYHKYFE